jgi:periplasmic protein TonB
MERVRRRDPLSAAALARLAFALLMSLGLHAVLLVRMEQGPGQPASGPVLRARIVPAAAEPPVRAPSPPRQSAPEVFASGAGTGAQPDAAPGAVAPVIAPGSATDVAERPDALRLPVDLNYYPAAELDIYPVPAQALAPALAAVPGGWVRLLVSIGETGGVDDAIVFDADPAGVFDAVALETVRRARFRPARRDGRDVRSRVLIEFQVPVAASAS